MPKKYNQEFVIDRAIWLRGDDGASYLLRASDGKMCCLGIYLHACGVPKRALKGQMVPTEVDRVFCQQASWLDASASAYHLTIANELMLANDDESYTSRQREAEIKQHFAKVGVKVTFEG